MSRCVLVISHHSAIGRGLHALLDTMSEVEVLAVVDSHLGVEHALATAPDVVVVEVGQARDGLDSLIGMLRTRCPKVRVVAFGIYPRQEPAAVRAGADAFVVSDASDATLRAAILRSDDISQP